MAYIKRIKLDLTTDGAGAAVGLFNTEGGGVLLQLIYVKHATNPYDNTVTFTVIEKDTGRVLLTTGAIAASANFQIRDATVSIANAALLFAAGGAAVSDAIPVSGAIQITLANGGANNDGTFYAYLG